MLSYPPFLSKVDFFLKNPLFVVVKKTSGIADYRIPYGIKKNSGWIHILTRSLTLPSNRCDVCAASIVFLNTSVSPVTNIDITIIVDI